MSFYPSKPSDVYLFGPSTAYSAGDKVWLDRVHIVTIGGITARQWAHVAPNLSLKLSGTVCFVPLSEYKKNRRAWENGLDHWKD